MESPMDARNSTPFDIRRVLNDYKAASRFELSIAKGDLVVIEEDVSSSISDSYWASGRLALTQNKGMVPLASLSPPLKGVRNELEAVQLNLMLKNGMRGMELRTSLSEDTSECYYENESSEVENPLVQDAQTSLNVNDEDFWSDDSFTDSEDEETVGVEAVEESMQMANIPADVVQIGRILSDYEINDGGSSVIVKGGEFVTVIDNDTPSLDGEELLVALRRDPYDVFFVPRNVLEVIPDLQSQPWYIGKVSRIVSDSLLMNSSGRNSFLVRDLDTIHNGYIISVRNGDQIKYKKMTPTDGHYSLLRCHAFRTILELIIFHCTCSDPALKLGTPFNKFGEQDTTSPTIAQRSFSSNVSPPVIRNAEDSLHFFNESIPFSLLTKEEVTQLQRAELEKISKRQWNQSYPAENTVSMLSKKFENMASMENLPSPNSISSNNNHEILRRKSDQMNLDMQLENINRIRQLHSELMAEQNRVNQGVSTDVSTSNALGCRIDSFPQASLTPSPFANQEVKHSTGSYPNINERTLYNTPSVSSAVNQTQSSPQTESRPSFLYGSQTDQVPDIKSKSDSMPSTINNPKSSRFGFFKRSSIASNNDSSIYQNENKPKKGSVKYPTQKPSTSEPSICPSAQSKKPKKKTPYSLKLPNPSFNFLSTKPKSWTSEESKPHKNLKSNIGRQWKVDRDDIEWLGIIGSGYYGDVWKGKWKGYNKYVAIKTFKSAKMSSKDFYKEATSMIHLRHPNLVKLFGINNKDEETFLVMEFHSFGSILDYFKKGNKLDSTSLKKFSFEVATGMDYLGDQGFVHRDLAARNVLIDSNLHAKIADFGLARNFEGNNNFSEDDLKMPWKWTAPEAFEIPPRWSVLSDVWSYGIFLWEIFSTGKHPYSNITQKPNLIKFLESSCRLSKPDKCESWVYLSIMLKCWELSPEERISFKEIKALWLSALSE